MKIAVDVNVGRKGIRILREAGHDVVVEAAPAERDESWFARAVAAGAEAVVSYDSDLGMKRPVVTEQQVGEVVVAYLEAMGADVYQEVEVSGGVADIVARVRAETWIIELKVALSLKLLTQAMDRRRVAHRVIVATPYTRHQGDVGVMCSELGIGLWEVLVPDPECTWQQPNVREVVAPRRITSKPVALAGDLKPEHKTHAKAGSRYVKSLGRWTPFRGTCEAVREIVVLEPGITVKACVEKIKHHYRTNKSAVSSIAHWVEHNKVDGVRIERGDGLRLFPVERPPP